MVRHLARYSGVGIRGKNKTAIKFFYFFCRQKNDPELLIALVSLVNGDPNCVRELVYSDFWSHIHYELAYDTITKKFRPLTDFNENNTTLIKKSKIKKTPKHVIHIAIIYYKRHNYKPHQKRLKDTWTLEKYLLEHEGKDFFY